MAFFEVGVKPEEVTPNNPENMERKLITQGITLILVAGCS